MLKLYLSGEVVWIQDTTHSPELEKDKLTHYLKKQKMIVGHSDEKVQNQLFFLVHPHCLHMHTETPAGIYIHESANTQDCFQSLVDEYKCLQCILKNKKKYKVHMIYS